MKKLILLTILTFNFILCFSQRITENIKSKELTFIFNNINQSFHYETKSNSFNFYLVKQRSNKFYFDGTDETLNDLYIGISEFGEHPKQQLFRISNIISIDTSKIRFNETNKKYFEFNYKVIEKGNLIKILNSKVYFK